MTADYSRIPRLQSHVKKYVKLDIYYLLWVFLDFLTLEDGANMLSRNVGTELSFYAA
jgi:hypothetical protein